jgi:hypothetical protein
MAMARFHELAKKNENKEQHPHGLTTTEVRELLSELRRLRPSLNGLTKICKGCGKEFIALDRRQNHCPETANACRVKASRRRTAEKEAKVKANERRLEARRANKRTYYTD